MPVQLLSAAAGNQLVGDRWIIDVMVLDADGDLVAAAPVVTVTTPSGATSTPTVDALDVGVYRAQYPIAAAGRHVALIAAAGYGTTDAVVAGQLPTYASGFPTVSDVDDYLTAGSGAHDWSTDDLAGVLAAETAAQARVCRIGAVYPADLREALLRRCQRNLAMRPNPLAIVRGDAEGGDPASFLPGNDPEVRRLERPYRKLPIG